MGQLDDVQRFLVALARTGSSVDTLPPAVVAAAEDRLLDTLGAIVAGRCCPLVQRASSAITSTTSDPMTSDAVATVIGAGRMASVDVAASLNATAGRYAELNDVYFAENGTGGHPSDVVAPVLAIAEAAGSSGGDLLAAVVVAYEAYTSLLEAGPIERHGYDHTNYARVAATLAASMLLGLDDDGIGAAVAMAATCGVALRQVRTAPLTMWKALASGEAARSAVTFARLAEHGVEGPCEPFSGACGWGRTLAAGALITPTSASDWHIGRTMIKPRAACMSTLAVAVAAEGLHGWCREPGAEIAAVSVRTYDDAVDRSASKPIHWSPISREDADHSIPYVAAAALSLGPVMPGHFDDEHLVDPAIRRLMELVEVTSDDEMSVAYARDKGIRGAKVDVTLTDGRTDSSAVRSIPGSPHHPLRREQLVEKFTLTSAGLMVADDVAACADAVWSLTTHETLAPLLATVAGRPVR